MRLSVIIPAYNNLDKLLRCLNTLQAHQRGAVEYLVQDDCSLEYDLSELIPATLAATERNAQNLGFPGNCNIGAARATGDVLFFVNQDVAATPEWSAGWDVALLAAIGDLSAAIVGARLLYPTGSIQSVGGLFDAKKQPFHRNLGWSNPLHPDANQRKRVSWVTGAALAVRADAFWQLGGFDTGYIGGYFEDVELCVKAQLAGGEVWFEPGCTLVHEVGTTGGNPRFAANAALFRERWQQVIEPDTMGIYARFW